MNRGPVPFALALSLGLAPGPAAALTCLPPTVERAFGAAHAAAEVYVPVIGRFTGFVPRAADDTLNGADRRYRARFAGHAMTAQGPGPRVAAEVAVTESCLGPWCPALTPEIPVLTFLQRDGAGYRFEVDACNGNLFPDPTDAQIEALQACLRTMACSGG